MTDEETERFVITDNSVSRVHTVDCPHVWHLVTKAQKEGFEQSDWEVAGHDQNGETLYREVRYEYTDHYSANYVTRKDLRGFRRKYVRCQVCAPDVPEVAEKGRALTRTMRPESLTPDHIGRRFTDVGVLARVVMSSEGYELEGDAGSARHSPKAVLRYFKEG